MTAYVIFDIEVIDQAGYDEYKQLAPATVTAYGGKYLARGSKTEVLEGEWVPKRLVILEFPNTGRSKEWLNSPEYSAIKHIRHRTTKSNMVVVEGLQPL